MLIVVYVDKITVRLAGLRSYKLETVELESSYDKNNVYPFTIPKTE